MIILHFHWLRSPCEDEPILSGTAFMEKNDSFTYKQRQTREKKNH